MLNISNYYERLVSDQLWKLIEAREEPMSQTFLEDVACLALNQLPVCYVRNCVDKSIDLTERQYMEMNDAVDAAINSAMEKVLRRPHDQRE